MKILLDGYVVFTHDLDFGAILAATRADCPSVLQLRTQDISPQRIHQLVLMQAIAAQTRERTCFGL